MSYFNVSSTTTILASILGSAGVGYFIYFTIQLYFYRLKFRHLPGPPAPKGILGFYTGNLPQIIEADKKGIPLCDLLNEWLKEYGKTIKYQLFNRIVILTIEPFAVRDILITKNFPKYPLIYKLAGFPVFSRFLGNGLVTQMDQNKWKHERALFNPGFYRQKLIEYLDEFNSKGNFFIEKLRSLADGKRMIQLYQEINHVTLDVIASIAFGMNTDTINDPRNKLNYYVNESFKGLNQLINDPLILFKPSGWLFVKNYRNILENLRSLGRVQIEKRIKAFAEDGQSLQKDLLGNIFESHENEAFDIENMTDQFVTFFLAGQETTANALAFCILALGRNPRVVKKLQEELDTVLGSREEISYQDLADLKYTGAVIKETLRLWPPVSSVSREVPENFKINDMEIPAGCWMTVGPYHSGRWEEFYPDAMEFYPERFMKETNEENNQNYTYFPFSLGPRNCLGQNFANMEAKVLLAKIVKNFDIELDKNQNFGVKMESTIRPKDGCRCILKTRDHH